MMNSCTACAIFTESTSESAFAVGRAMRRLYRPLLVVDTAPSIFHCFGELVAVEDVTF